MDTTKEFTSAADFFFDSCDETLTATEKYDIREIISEEKLSKRVQLTIYPSAFEQARLKAKSQGRSFNNYVNELILKDLSK